MSEGNVAQFYGKLLPSCASICHHWTATIWLPRIFGANGKGGNFWSNRRQKEAICFGKYWNSNWFSTLGYRELINYLYLMFTWDEFWKRSLHLPNKSERISYLSWCNTVDIFNIWCSMIIWFSSDISVDANIWCSLIILFAAACLCHPHFPLRQSKLFAFPFYDFWYFVWFEHFLLNIFLSLDPAVDGQQSWIAGRGGG